MTRECNTAMCDDVIFGLLHDKNARLGSLVASYYYLSHSVDLLTSQLRLPLFCVFSLNLMKHFVNRSISFSTVSCGHVQRVKLESLKIHSSNNERPQPSVMTMATTTPTALFLHNSDQICTLFEHGETTMLVVEQSKAKQIKSMALHFLFHIILCALHCIKQRCVVFDNGLKAKLTGKTHSLPIRKTIDLCIDRTSRISKEIE